MLSIDKLIKTAIAELGYLEKKSNKDLDDKTANAGDKNYTKYARDIYPDLQGDYWCDMFVDWCFVEAFGKEKAKKLLGGFSAYTPTSAQYFKTKNQYHKGADVKIGDVIFFRNSQRICHTGIVENVIGNKIYTIEGNTSSEPGVVANGGCVRRKSYVVGDAYIDGYGRPDYAEVEETVEGWHKDDKGWWYRYKNGVGSDTYYYNTIKEINNKIYAFDRNGYLIYDIKKLMITSDGDIIVGG